MYASANLPCERWSFGVRGQLNDQSPFLVIVLFGANRFDAPFPIGAEKIKPEAVFLWIDFRYKLAAQQSPLRRIDHAFKNRILYPLAVILACLGNPAQSFPTSFI